MGNSVTVDAGQQHLRALERANRVRLARAELKRRVAAEAISVAEVVASCPWEAESMSISELLMSQRRWGTTRCRRVLRPIGVPENKPVGKLTDRQRSALAAVLGGDPARAVTRAPAPAAAVGVEPEYSTA